MPRQSAATKPAARQPAARESARRGSSPRCSARCAWELAGRQLVSSRPLVGVDTLEGCDNLTVELGTCLRPKDVQRLFVWARRTVRPISGDRIERVSYRDDPRCQGDALARQPTGIPRAVQTLVMVAH